MDGDYLKQAPQDSAVSSRPQHIQSFQRMVAPNSAVATESGVANYQIPTVLTSSEVQKIILACNKQSSSQATHELVKSHVIQLPLAKRLAGANDVPTFVAMLATNSATSVTSDKLLATNGATSVTSAKLLTTDGATSVTFAKLLATNGATSVTSAKILASHQMPTKNNLSEKQQLAIAYLHPPAPQASCVSVSPQIVQLPNRLLVTGRMISVKSAEPQANYPTGNDLSKKQRIRLAYLPVTPNVLHFSQRMPAPNRTVSVSVTSAEPATSHQILTVNDQPENQSIKQVYRKQTPCYNSVVPKTPQAIKFSKRTFAPNSTVSVSAPSAEPIASYQIPAMNNLSDKQVMALAYRQQPSSQDSVVSETPKHIHYSRNVSVPTSTVSVRVSHSVYKPVNQPPATNLSSHTTQQQFMAIDSFTKPSKEGVDRPVDHTTNKVGISFSRLNISLASSVHTHDNRWLIPVFPKYLDTLTLNTPRKPASENVVWLRRLLNILANFSKKVREKSRECHNHKPQPFPDPKRKRKPTNLNKHKPNKRTKSTKISSLFPKRGNRNTKRTEKHKNKMTHGKTTNKSPRRINHKTTKSKTNTGKPIFAFRQTVWTQIRLLLVWSGSTLFAKNDF